jgi:hypothetical protein
MSRVRCGSLPKLRSLSLCPECSISFKAIPHTLRLVSFESRVSVADVDVTHQRLSVMGLTTIEHLILSEPQRFPGSTKPASLIPNVAGLALTLHNVVRLEVTSTYCEAQRVHDSEVGELEPEPGFTSMKILKVDYRPSSLINLKWAKPFLRRAAGLQFVEFVVLSDSTRDFLGLTMQHKFPKVRSAALHYVASR